MGPPRHQRGRRRVSLSRVCVCVWVCVGCVCVCVCVWVGGCVCVCVCVRCGVGGVLRFDCTVLLVRLLLLNPPPCFSSSFLLFPRLLFFWLRFTHCLSPLFCFSVGQEEKGGKEEKGNHPRRHKRRTSLYIFDSVCVCVCVCLCVVCAPPLSLDLSRPLSTSQLPVLLSSSPLPSHPPLLLQTPPLPWRRHYRKRNRFGGSC